MTILEGRSLAAGNADLKLLQVLEEYIIKLISHCYVYVYIYTHRERERD